MTQIKTTFFEDVCAYFKNNESRYISNFNFSACELWLCNEICKVINFDLKLQESSKGSLFCYNEDQKRDLSIYTSRPDGYAELLEHIEVKLIYPTTKSKSDIYQDDLINKIICTHKGSHQVSGWVFFIWTDHYKGKYTPENFTADKVDNFKQSIADRVLDLQVNNLHHIIDDYIHWRGEEKRIVVNALTITQLRTVLVN